MNLSYIFSLSWKQLFKNKKSLGIIFLFQVLPTTVLLIGGICLSLGARYLIPFFGIDMNNMNFLARITTPAGITIITIIGLLLLLVWFTFQLICSYLSSQGLAWNFQNKSYTLKSLVKSWRGMWPWAGTGLAVVAQFLAIFLVGFILALGFAYIHEYLALIPGVLTLGVFIFFSVSLSLSLPVYFFEWKKYFEAIKISGGLVRGRWWKTFWYAVLAITITIAASLLFAVLEMLTTEIGQYLPLSLLNSRTFTLFLGFWVFCFSMVQMFSSVIVQMFIQSMTFTIYQSYSSTPTAIRITKKSR